jgi:photosystem I reaction center subunit VIII
MVMTLADQPFAASWLPTVLVPVSGLLFPGYAMASLFLYISKNKE